MPRIIIVFILAAFVSMCYGDKSKQLEWALREILQALDLTKFPKELHDNNRHNYHATLIEMQTNADQLPGKAAKTISGSCCSIKH